MIDATFKKLHQSFDDQNTSNQDLSTALERNFPRFLSPLSIPKPSSGARDSIRSKTIDWRGEAYTLSDAVVKEILGISDFLELNETESFVLLRNLMLYERKDVRQSQASFGPGSVPKLELLDYFYEEQLSVLRCLCSIFRIADDENEQFFSQCRDVAERLITGGLNGNLKKALFKFPAPPQSLAGQRTWRDRWARFQVEVQEELLRLLFLICYNREVSNEILKDLVAKCLNESFGERPKILPLLDDSGRKTVTRIQYLSVLLVLECMNLERYTSHSSGPWLGSDKVEEITELIYRDMDTRGSRKSEDGAAWRLPVYLAWSALLKQFSYEEDMNALRMSRRERNELVVLDPRTNIQVLLGQAGGKPETVDYLCRLLSSFENEPNSNIIGYKTIVHGFLSLVTTAIPEMVASLPSLINLYPLVFQDSIVTCAQFWQVDFEHKPPLFEKARKEFPFRFLPYMQLLTALVHDLESSQRVQSLLEQATSFAAPEGLSLSGALQQLPRGAHDPHEQRVQLDRAQAVQITCWYDLQEANVPLPARAGGYLHHPASSSKKDPESGTFVSWWVEYSAFDMIFLRLIDAFLVRVARFDLLMPHVEQITAIFSLFAKLLPYQSASTVDGPDYLLAHAPGIIQRLLDVLQKVTTLVGSPRFAHVVKPKLVATHAESSIAPKICELLESCLVCLGLYALNDPLAVWLAVQRCRLLESFGQRRPSMSSSSSTSVHIPSVFFSLESSMGRYPVTIAFLHLIYTLLQFLKSWPVSGKHSSSSSSSLLLLNESSMLASPFSTSTSKIYHNLPNQSTIAIDDDDDDSDNDTNTNDISTMLTADAFEPALFYLRTDVLSCFARGRFAKISDRWQMGCGFLNIIESMLSDPTLSSSSEDKQADSSASQGNWLKSVAFESTFLHTLLSVVATGHSFLDKSRLRFGKQSQTLERLLLVALSVLERLLLLDEKGRVRQTLLTRTIGKDNVHLVFVIASYIYYVHNPSIPLVATRILAHLCRPQQQQQQAESRPVSLLGYMGGNEEQLRAVFLYRLSKKTESAKLRVAILNFLSTCIEHQPGLADMFFNLPRREADRSERVRTRYQAGGGAVDTTDSCLDVVVSIIGGHHSPELFAAAVSMLHTLWKLASQHHSPIRYLRQVPDFWKSLVGPVIDNINPRIFRQNSDATLAAAQGRPVTHDAADAADIDELSIPDKGAFPECFRIVSRALTLKILTLEILNQPSSELSEQVKVQLASIQDSQVAWMNSFCLVHFNSQVTQKLEAAAKQLGVPLKRALAQGPQRSYGSSYVYDYEIIVKKLDHAKKQAEVQMFCELVEQTNWMFSLAEAELLLLRSWCRFVQITANFNIIKYTSVSEASDTSFNLISGLAGFLEGETRHSVMAIKKLNEISALLESLLHIRRSQLANNRTDTRIKLADIIANLIKTVRRVNEHLARFPPSLGHRRDSNPSFHMLLSIQRCLLTSLFFLLGPGPAPNFSKECRTLLPELGLALAHPPLLDIGLSILQRVVSSHLTGPGSEVPPEAFIATLRDEKMCPKVLDFLTNCLDNEAHPATALLAAHLVLSLSQNQHTAEALSVSGYMTMLMSRSFARFAAKITHYTSDQQRSTWHQIWCLTISSICSLIRQMGFSHSFLNQAFSFVKTHFDRLMQPLHLASTITLAQLEEVQCITKLFTQLIVFKADWMVELGHTAALHQQQMLEFMSDCIYRLLNHEALQQSCHPVTKQERDDEKEEVVCSQTNSEAALTPQKPGQDRRGRKRPSATAASSRQPIKERVFFRQVEAGLLACLLNTLSFVRRISPDPCLFGADLKVATLDPESIVPIFSPVVSSSTADDGVQPLGIIVDLLNLCAARLGQLDAQEGESKKAKEGQPQLSPELQQKTRHLICQLVDEALYIVLGHIGWFDWRSTTKSQKRSLHTRFVQLGTIKWPVYLKSVVLDLLKRKLKVDDESKSSQNSSTAKTSKAAPFFGQR